MLLASGDFCKCFFGGRGELPPPKVSTFTEVGVSHEEKSYQEPLHVPSIATFHVGNEIPYPFAGRASTDPPNCATDAWETGKVGLIRGQRIEDFLDFLLRIDPPVS